MRVVAEGGQAAISPEPTEGEAIALVILDLMMLSRTAAVPVKPARRTVPRR